MYIACVVGVGIFMSRRAGHNIEEFFVSGRNLIWPLIAASMVAAAFSSDTPLMIAGLVRKYGVSGAWYYWNGILGGLLSALVFASFWRRSMVVTDAEFRELRYSGVGGKMARFSWAAYQGTLCNCLSIGWIILSAVKIFKATLGLPPQCTLVGITMASTVWVVIFVLLAVLLYASLSGLSGIVKIDFFQFFVALAGSVILAIMSLGKVGGFEKLYHSLSTMPETGDGFTNVVPSFGTVAMTYFLVGLCIQWWASPWVDGGIYNAQRMLAAKNEKHAILGRLWATVGQMGIVIWPWIITALCSMVLFPASQYPDVAGDPESAYPKMIVAILPKFVRGFVVASLLAAFMSTIDSLLNNTSSYMVNDLYKRFLVRNAAPRHYVLMGRVCMALTLIIAGLIAVASKNIVTLSMLAFELSGGIGIIFILRWLWWRINAWSELSAYVTGIFGATLVNIKFGQIFLMNIVLLFTPESKIPFIQNFFTNEINGMNGFPFRISFVAIFTAVICLIVTLLTAPGDTDHLVRFYKRVKPAGLGWRKISQIAGPNDYAAGELRFQWPVVIFGMIMFWSIFYGTARFSLGRPLNAAIAFAVAAISGIFLWKRLGTSMPGGGGAERDDVEKSKGKCADLQPAEK
jgi:SSS family solute:Na+ symporter